MDSIQSNFLGPEYVILNYLEVEDILVISKTSKQWREFLETELEHGGFLSKKISNAIGSPPKEFVEVLGGIWKVLSIPKVDLVKFDHITKPIMRGHDHQMGPFFAIAFTAYKKGKLVNIFYQAQPKIWQTAYLGQPIVICKDFEKDSKNIKDLIEDKKMFLDYYGVRYALELKKFEKKKSLSKRCSDLLTRMRK